MNWRCKSRLEVGIALLFSANQRKLLATGKSAYDANFGNTSISDARFGGASFWRPNAHELYDLRGTGRHLQHQLRLARQWQRESARAIRGRGLCLHSHHVRLLEPAQSRSEERTSELQSL